MPLSKWRARIVTLFSVPIILSMRHLVQREPILSICKKMQRMHGTHECSQPNQGAGMSEPVTVIVNVLPEGIWFTGVAWALAWALVRIFQVLPRGRKHEN
jgi:hypothetical protein